MKIDNLILATLAYSDIFDYPLNFEELHQKLIFKKVSRQKIAAILEKLVSEKKIVKFGKFYQLPRSENLAKKRVLRAKFAAEKLKKAKFAAAILSFIPTVKLVGISGALATDNTPKADDIDFFIVTSANFLWTSRFFCNLFLDFFALRRKPEDKKVVNKICLNMFTTEAALNLEPGDLYLAHEILQMKPLFERDNTYYKFLKANLWVFGFLPNWVIDAKRRTTNDKRKHSQKTLVVRPLALAVENLLKNFQLKLMARRKTTEKISDTKLFFHPQDSHQMVLAEFENRLKALKIPLDKVVL